MNEEPMCSSAKSHDEDICKNCEYHDMCWKCPICGKYMVWYQNTLLCPDCDKYQFYELNPDTICKDYEKRYNNGKN